MTYGSTELITISPPEVSSLIRLPPPLIFPWRLPSRSFPENSKSQFTSPPVVSALTSADIVLGSWTTRFPPDVSRSIPLLSLRETRTSPPDVDALSLPSLSRTSIRPPDVSKSICPTIASQVGAVAALQVGRAYCRPRVKELASIRDIVVSELSALAPVASVPAADGAFYALLRVNTTLDPILVGERLVREHKVAVIPGTAFGMSDGCYFRVAYGALQKATVAEGIGRLVRGLRALLS